MNAIEWLPVFTKFCVNKLSTMIHLVFNGGFSPAEKVKNRYVPERPDEIAGRKSHFGRSCRN